MITGIYKITNKINNKVYIGQSIDIKRRWSEHKRAYKSKNNEKIILYKAFKKYGIDNFKFEIIDICEEKDLDELEIKYIEQYRTYISFEDCNGYNMTLGGDYNCHLCGENNCNSKMTEEYVKDIRTRYALHELKFNVYEIYKDIISINTFSDIWFGKTWKNIMPEVFTEENKKFHSKIRHAKPSKGIIEEDDVLNIRNLKNKGYKRKEVMGMYSDINESTFNDIWYNKTFKHIVSNEDNNYKKYSRKLDQYGTKILLLYLQKVKF